MPIRTALILLICLVFLKPAFGQEGKDSTSLKKLEFNKGLPKEILLLNKNFKNDSGSFTEIKIDETNEEFSLFIYRTSGNVTTYYVFRKDDPAHFNELLFACERPDEAAVEKIELKDDDSYNNYLILQKKGDEFCSRIQKEKKRQIYESGLIFETGLFFYNEQHYNQVYQNTGNSDWYTESEKKSSGHCLPWGLYYSGKFLIGDNIKLEFRPGFISESNLYGLELGMFIHYRIYRDIFIAAGTIIHLPYPPYTKGNGYNGPLSDSFSIPTLSVIYSTSPKISFLVSCIVLKDNIKYYWQEVNHFDGWPVKRENIYKELSWGLKLGVDVHL